MIYDYTMGIYRRRGKGGGERVEERWKGAGKGTEWSGVGDFRLVALCIEYNFSGSLYITPILYVMKSAPVSYYHLRDGLLISKNMYLVHLGDRLWTEIRSQFSFLFFFSELTLT